MDQIVQYVEPAKQFAKDSIRLVKRCTKPDRKGMESTKCFYCMTHDTIVKHFHSWSHYSYSSDT